MATYDNGNLKPLMLSDLIKVAQKAIEDHGDMPVGIEACIDFCGHNQYIGLPVSDDPCVSHPKWIGGYWDGAYGSVFVLDGA